jgi:hypothetical protein
MCHFQRTQFSVVVGCGLLFLVFAVARRSILVNARNSMFLLTFLVHPFYHLYIKLAFCVVDCTCVISGCGEAAWKIKNKTRGKPHCVYFRVSGSADGSRRRSCKSKRKKNTHVEDTVRIQEVGQGNRRHGTQKKKKKSSRKSGSIRTRRATANAARYVEMRDAVVVLIIAATHTLNPKKEQSKQHVKRKDRKSTHTHAHVYIYIYNNRSVVEAGDEARQRMSPFCFECPGPFLRRPPRSQPTPPNPHAFYISCFAFVSCLAMHLHTQCKRGKVRSTEKVHVTEPTAFPHGRHTSTGEASATVGLNPSAPLEVCLSIRTERDASFLIERDK